MLIKSNNMKKVFYTIAALLSSFAAQSQTASVMAIHNSADPALDSVDVYLLHNGNSTLLENNFAFRESTGFINAPANAPIRIVFAGKTSTSIADSVIGFGFNLPENGKFILMAQGHLGSGFNPQKAFTLNVAANVENSNTSGVNKIAVYHGSTDAPSVKITAFSKTTPENLVSLAASASYGDVTAYTSVPNGDYLINIGLPNSDEALFTYAASLKTAGLSGEPIFAFASGFLTPSSNNNGKPFGVFAALKNGTVIELPLQSTSKLQIVHNSPDQAAASVDIYSDVTGSIQMLVDNLNFRKATPFLTVPANKTFNVWIAPGNSTSYTQSVFDTEINLYGGIDVIATALGVLDTTKFDNTNFVEFDLSALATNTKSNVSNTTDIVVLHGSTDAPAVDVRVGSVSGNKIVDNASFFDNTSVINVPSTDITLFVLPAGQSTAVAAYSAPLSAFKDSSIMVMASGFLSPNVPANKDNGAAFGLFAVTASGRVIELPSVNTNLTKIEKSNITMYPNPSNGVVYFNETVRQINVIDNTGKLVSVFNNINSIDISELVNGIYYLNIVSETGTFNQKIVKE